jgi:hypothetical protein
MNDAYHDLTDERNWPLSRNRLQKLKERHPDVYATYNERCDAILNVHLQEQEEEYENSPKRLRDRLDELEDRVRTLENPEA